MVSWYVPYHKLDSEQSKMINDMVNDLGHIHWVKGFAGTGKSTVLLNFAQQLQGMNNNKSFCFITYTHALVELLKVAVNAHQLKNMAVMTHTQFLNQPYRYHFVFLDEVQDISEADLLQIRQRADYLFLAGDCEQNIYEQSTREDQIRTIFGPKEHELTFMHRLTANIQKIASKILINSGLIYGKEKNTNADTTAKLIKFDAVQDEYEWLEKEAMQRSKPFKPYAILFSFHEDIENFYKFLSHKYNIKLNYLGKRLDYAYLNKELIEKGLNFCYLGNGFGSLEISDSKPIVYIMTIHSSKGLDFQGVFIPHLNANRRFHWQDVEGLEQRMLFVATTRTRQDLFLTYTSDKPHEFLRDIPNEYLIHHKALVVDDSDDDDGDIF